MSGSMRHVSEDGSTDRAAASASNSPSRRLRRYFASCAVARRAASLLGFSFAATGAAVQLVVHFAFTPRELGALPESHVANLLGVAPFFLVSGIVLLVGSRDAALPRGVRRLVAAMLDSPDEASCDVLAEVASQAAPDLSAQCVGILKGRLDALVGTGRVLTRIEEQELLRVVCRTSDARLAAVIFLWMARTRHVRLEMVLQLMLNTNRFCGDDPDVVEAASLASTMADAHENARSLMRASLDSGNVLELPIPSTETQASRLVGGETSIRPAGEPLQRTDLR